MLGRAPPRLLHWQKILTPELQEKMLRNTPIKRLGEVALLQLRLFYSLLHLHPHG